MSAVLLTRPALRWHGGKWLLAPWIIAQFPPHRIYVEPFGGAASVLLRKPRSYAEVYNDLDGAVVSLFRVLRAPAAAERLIELLRLTPFSRAEFEAAYARTEDAIEAARRLIVRSFMGHGSGAPFYRTTGFRGNANASGAHNTAAEWAGYPDALRAIVERLRGVVIERAEALDVIERSDTAETLHYLDPPYMPEMRSPRARRGGTLYHAYAHEMTRADHEEMLRRARGLAGMVVISGYRSALYDAALADWRRVETRAYADGARPRTEVLWLNPQACAALRQAAGGPLFNRVEAS